MRICVYVVVCVCSNMHYTTKMCMYMCGGILFVSSAALLFLIKTSRGRRRISIKNMKNGKNGQKQQEVNWDAERATIATITITLQIATKRSEMKFKRWKYNNIKRNVKLIKDKFNFGCFFFDKIYHRSCDSKSHMLC